MPHCFCKCHWLTQPLVTIDFCPGFRAPKSSTSSNVGGESEVPARRATWSPRRLLCNVLIAPVSHQCPATIMDKQLYSRVQAQVGCRRNRKAARTSPSSQGNFPRKDRGINMHCIETAPSVTTCGFLDTRSATERRTKRPQPASVSFVQ